jgi:hypothetical protein
MKYILGLPVLFPSRVRSHLVLVPPPEPFCSHPACFVFGSKQADDFPIVQFACAQRQNERQGRKMSRGHATAQANDHTPARRVGAFAGVNCKKTNVAKEPMIGCENK